MDDIVELLPLKEYRWHQPSEWQAPVFQWRYWARLGDGSEGFLWLELPRSVD
jgi:hypothetical protein